MEDIENKESAQEDIIMLGASSSSAEKTAEEPAECEANIDECVEPLETVDSTVSDEGNQINTESSQLGEISESLQGLSEKIDQMNQLFMQKIAHTTHEEKIVDQMHAELQKYKQDMYAQLVRPILLDIIEMRDSILRMSSSYALKPEGEQNIPLKTFSDYAFDVQDILEKNNIIIYDSVEGDEFNAIKQKAIKKVTTPVESLHGKIAESLSSGYEYLGKPISPEKVVVYVYEKPVSEEGDSNNG